MPAPMGGLGQQVADNLFELGKSTAQSAVKAGGDIVKGTMEQLTGAPGGAGKRPGDNLKNQTEEAEVRMADERRQKEQQRYQQVKAELEEYRQRRQQLDQQIAREKALQNQEKQQKEAVEKQEKESFVQKMLRKVGASAHGETAKQKE